MPFRPARLLAVANAIAPGLIDRGMRQLAKVRRLQPKERPKTQDPRPKTQD
jgi:hypothetical protein